MAHGTKSRSKTFIYDPLLHPASAAAATSTTCRSARHLLPVLMLPLERRKNNNKREESIRPLAAPAAAVGTPQEAESLGEEHVPT